MLHRKLHSPMKWLRSPVRLCVFLFALSLVAMVAQPTYAFTVRGFKWQSNRTSYTIDSSFSNSGTSWYNVARYAAGDWTNATSANFIFSQAQGSSGNHFVAGNLGCTGTYPLAQAGLVGTNGYFTQFTLRINTWCGDAYYDGTQTSYLPSNYYDLRSVIRHELGHALGLCHSANSTYLMYGTSFEGQRRFIDTDARNGALYIYQTGYNGPGPEVGGCPE